MFQTIKTIFGAIFGAKPRSSQSEMTKPIAKKVRKHEPPIEQSDDGSPLTYATPLCTAKAKANPDSGAAIRVDLEFSPTNGDRQAPTLSSTEIRLRDALAVRVLEMFWILRGLGVSEDDAKKFIHGRTGRWDFATLQRRSQTSVPQVLGMPAKAFNSRNKAHGKELREQLKDKEFRAKLGLEPGIDFNCGRDAAKVLWAELDICAALKIADLRARALGIGLRKIDAKLRRGENVSTELVEFAVLGSPAQQENLDLPPHRVFYVAAYGYVDPTNIWPEYAPLKDFFLLSLMVGRLLANRSTFLTPSIARVFLTEVRNHAFGIPSALVDASKKSSHSDVAPALAEDQKFTEVDVLISRIAGIIRAIPGLERIIESLSIEVDANNLVLEISRKSIVDRAKKLP